MRSFKHSGSGAVMNTVASLFLFFVFTLCMIIIIGAGAGIYSRISNGYETTYGSAAAVRYVSNKIKAADSCEIIEDGKGIALISGNILSVIYSGGGGLYEKTLSFGSEITAEGGDVVVKSADMLVSETDKMYKIAISCGDDDFSVFIRKG